MGLLHSLNLIAPSRQVFYPYHWLVYPDGSVKQLLRNREIGWHAGNWEVNCRSIAIALVGDYTNSVPSIIVLQAVADIIRTHYRFILKDGIIGHREVKMTAPRTTTCPGNLFLGPQGWKQILLDLIFTR